MNPAPQPTEQARLADYERTVATIHQLIDVRFKLAAFVPTLTGAAVALLTNSSAGPLFQATLAVGGLTFVLGVVIYDLRNNQHYNAATGRAERLERVLALDTFEDDLHPGVYGSRRDSTTNLRTLRKTTIFRVPVRHGVALSLIYASTVGAWVWALLRAIALAFEDPKHPHAPWLRAAPHAEWIATVCTGVIAATFLIRHRRIDSDARKKEPTSAAATAT